MCILRKRNIHFNLNIEVGDAIHSNTPSILILVFFMVVGNCTGQTKELTVEFLQRSQVLTWMAHLQRPFSLETWNTWSFSLLISRIRNSTGRSPAGEWYEHPFSLLVFLDELMKLILIILSCLECVQW